MQNYEIGIPIIVEASIGFASSLFFILDISIHYNLKLYQLELGILYTNMIQSIIMLDSFKLSLGHIDSTKKLFTDKIPNLNCTRISKNQLIYSINYQIQLQAIIAFGLPIIASSLIFVKLNICQLETITQVSSKLFWAIQSILTLILIGIITYHIIRVHLYCKFAKFYLEILYCPLIFIFSLPWIVYTIFNYELDGSNDLITLQGNNCNISKGLFLLKNSQIFLSTFIFGQNSTFQVAYLENACPILRKTYLAKYDFEGKKNNSESLNIEICNNICSQLLIK
ncbi:unnamed protein product [Paramecium sonneborni]|uniref:Transmembrane protein n=1 Tax=Paramecium sonneborni TaxID=65129 RepID=A0A8S1MXQ0_9CILI|nr:unnamed protein product [Paramecium sonneborni]